MGRPAGARRAGRSNASVKRRGRGSWVRSPTGWCILAGLDGWLLVGGTPVAAREAYAALPARVAARARLVQALHKGATGPEIAAMAATAASSLRRDEDCAAVRRVLEGLGAAGRGVVGPDETFAALAERRVERLFVSLAFLEQRGAEAEIAVREAFAQRIAAEAVAGAGAELLDARAGGIAGELRYVVSNGASQ